ncbi:MAG: type 1 glutamine amidotransferase domain-containing protein, partial [Candidatus Saccharicenans sp.]|nr:type 1 glutamine amidotransferase domain-containing protein [Candidatus Saccharicenans sp.]
AEEPEIEEAIPVKELSGKSVAILIAEGFHDGETLEPKAFLEEHGAEVIILGPAVGEVKAYNSDQVVNIEKAVDEADVEEFDALILPGGKGPAVLREHEAAVAFAKAFFESGKPVAAICHGPQVLITAGVVEGRSMTGTSQIAEELKEAGAEYLDEPVVVDGNLITSRTPDDLPKFNEAILNALKNNEEQ